MFKKILTAAAVAAVMCGSASAVAADFKIGLVSPARILAESAPAVAAQEKLKTYFKKREDELNRDIRDFRTRAQKFEKDAPVMTDSERLKQRQSLAETERDIARRQRALVDIAKKQEYDLIIQDAIWVSPKVDITEQVIKELNKPAK